MTNEAEELKEVLAKYSIVSIDEIPYYFLQGTCPECGHQVHYSDEFEMKPHYNKVKIECDDCLLEFKLTWQTPKS